VNLNKKKVPPVKKGRVPPAVRAAEQLEKERIKEEKERIKAEKMTKKYVEKHGALPADNNEAGEKGEKKRDKTINDSREGGEKSKKPEED